MKRALSLLLAIALLVFCAACQPTPEEEIVTNKGDGVMEEKIFATAEPTAEVEEEEASPEPTAIPFEKVTHWTESFPVNDALTVEIDCDVEWGEGYQYSVEKYSRGTFTKEQIIEIANTFFGGVESIREQEKSYDELLEELMQLDRGICVGYDDNGEPIYEPYSKKYKKERTKKLKEQLAETPVESTYIPFETDNLTLEEDAYNSFTIRKADGTEGRMGAQLLNGRIRKLRLENYTKGDTTNATSLEQEILFGEYRGTLPEPSITLEEAIAKADAFLISIGLESMECSYWDKARLRSNGETVSEGWYLEYAYALKGTRGVNLVAFQRNALFSSELASSYSEPWSTEYITLYVTEEGVESFSYENPFDLQEVTNGDVSTLTFEEMQESVRKYFNLAFAWADTSAVGSSFERLSVKRIVLTSYFVQVKDEPNAVYRMPVWAIFYITNVEEDAMCENSVMLINALDGTMIYK